VRGYQEVALHPMVDAVFQALDRERLRWCLLRGEAVLAQASGDVDLLVFPADLQRFRRIVGELGFAPIPAWGYGSHRFFMSYDTTMDAWVKLDVVTDIAFGPGFTLRTAAEVACLERHRRRGRLAVLDDEDAFWALLLHRLLDKGCVTEDSATRLRELAAAARADGPLATVVDAFSPPNWSAVRLLSLARNGEWEALVAFGPQLSASWRRRARTAVWRRWSVNTISRWAGRLLRLHYRRGLSVAVLAPDGAGKSTLVQGLRETFAFPTRTLYMGPYQQRMGRPMRALPPGVGLAARLYVLWGRWLEGTYHRSRGRLVVFDRYVTDALLPSRRALSLLSRARRWLIGHCVPGPDLMIVLDAPGAVLHQRKGEQKPEVLEAERRAYRALVQGAQRGVVIDATQPEDQVRREATAAVWRAYSQRWGRWCTPPCNVAQRDVKE
jgi:thymidylate kinase